MNPLISIARRTLRFFNPANMGGAGQRHFQAGRINRLNRSWPTLQTSMRADLHRGLRNMRARMRFLAKNSDHFNKYLSLYRNNVAGPYGMKLQVRGGTEE